MPAVRCSPVHARAELPVNKNSGCGHDAELVWVWEECDHQPGPFVCAAEDANCDCVGTVYYGRKYAPGGAQLETLEEMLAYTTFNTSSNGVILCGNAEFGDPAAAVEKQCFCELSTVKLERRVAAEGGDITNYSCDLTMSRM